MPETNQWQTVTAVTHLLWHVQWAESQCTLIKRYVNTGCWVLPTWKSCNATIFSCFSSFKREHARVSLTCIQRPKHNWWRRIRSELTFNILISFPSRVCDFARFFLLMHFTATSQSCFYFKTHTHANVLLGSYSDHFMLRGTVMQCFVQACPDMSKRTGNVCKLILHKMSHSDVTPKRRTIWDLCLCVFFFLTYHFWRLAAIVVTL